MSDLISRQDAIAIATQEGAYGYISAEELAEMPSAQQKGMWTRHTRVEPVYSIDGIKTWGIKTQCNRCCFATTAVEGFGYYRYCPNCGADMRGEKEDE